MSKNNNNKDRSIDRRSFIKTTGAVSAAVAAGALSAPAIASEKKSRPGNILLIITDQQHIDSVKAGGCPYVQTPAMDQLVQSGVSFEQSYSTNPVCSPARGSIFTGRTSCETGVYKNGIGIRDDIPNLGQWLSLKAGYEAIYAGKWHVPEAYTQFIPGFNVLNTGIGGLGYFGDISVSRACQGYIRNHDKKKPFFMVASFMQPHDICEWLRLNTENPEKLRYPEIKAALPELPANFEYDKHEPKAIKKRRQSTDAAIGGWDIDQWKFYRWSYFRHIEFVDAEIGRVLQALGDFGYLKDTLIIFTSDHGEGMAHHQMVRKNWPYDEAARVPFIFSWPGHIPENRIDKNQLASGLDIVPTICDYVGIESPENVKGRSLRKAMEGHAGQQVPFIVTELISNTQRVVRSPEYKYIHCKDDPVEMLFDMQNDPGETKNLAAGTKYAGVLAEHRKMLRGWEMKLDPADDVPNVKYWRDI